MTRRGRLVLLVVALFATVPLFGDDSQEDRIRRIEQRLDELSKQQEQLRQELDQLKASQPSAPANPPLEDLTAVDNVGTTADATNAQTVKPSSETQPALTDIQTIENVANPGAAKALNPDIAAIGNFMGKTGNSNPYEFGPGDAMRSPLRLEEAELAFQAWIDPYAKASVFLSASPEGVEIEEVYAQFVTLPWDLTARAGRFKAMFGKANTWHTHVRPWVDQPLMIHNFFTDEQLSDDGIEISRVFPNRIAFVEATVDVLSGNDSVFRRRKQSDLAYAAHLRVFRDITENSNIEVGGSYARGARGDSLLRPGASSRFGALDVTYRWKPLLRSVYKSMIVRLEGLVNDRTDLDHRLTGYYGSVDYQLARRWFAGVRLDRADRADTLDAARVMASDSRFTDRGVSATLTFWPSEFSQLRGQLRHTSYGGLKSVNELLFQLQFSIGAHGAHAF